MTSRGHTDVTRGANPRTRLLIYLLLEAGAFSYNIFFFFVVFHRKLAYSSRRNEQSRLIAVALMPTLGALSGSGQIEFAMFIVRLLSQSGCKRPEVYSFK